ncbi:hypothetical protein I8D64_01565 [Brachybacterium sp. MASK1Z-5]|uniref:DUF4878 domain-containing protein n=1 Tax=Brachybacterium halotolerans TaxID=2795215 RepID=A0ABS1B624_9MICO|nr:hypothetical protein [Brachybacterium halotolerans]MBK0330094.1 hypothetical protein [Brachybacterium halotolerans]
MKTRIRGIAKGLAVGTGSLALALSLAACGGSSSDDASGDDGGKVKAGESTDSDSSSDDSSSSEDTSSDEATDDSSSDDAASDDSSAADDSTSDDSSSDEKSDNSGSKDDVTDADLKAAKSRYIDFMNALADKDAKKACGFAMDPSTKKPIDGAALKVCAKQIEDSGMMDTFTPELVDAVDESMLDAKAEDDGTITLSIEGSNETPMEKATDGKWYFKM